MPGYPFIELQVAGLYATAGDIAGLKNGKETILDKTEGLNREISLAQRVENAARNLERILIDLIKASCNIQH